MMALKGLIELAALGCCPLLTLACCGALLRQRRGREEDRVRGAAAAVGNTRSPGPAPGCSGPAQGRR